MPHFSGRTARNVPQVGEISHAEIPSFIKQCRAEGWRRCAVTEVRILATFNENGEWLHPEIEGAA